MSQLTIDLYDAQEIAADADLDEDAVYANYSGRGMYGRECLGFTFSSDSTLLRLGVALHRHFGGDLPADVRTDSLGCDRIVYFPQLAVTTDAA